MNVPLILATGLSLLALLAHALTGENALLLPLVASDLSPALKALATILWHGTTGILFINTVMLAWTIFRPNNLIIHLISFQYLFFALAFFAVGQMQLGSPMILPQWIVGALISSLCTLATNPRFQ